MRTLKELGNSQKYLKATSVASYRSDIAYETPRWSFGRRIHLKDGWNLLLRKTRYLFGEYAISNAFVFAFVAKTKSRVAEASGPYAALKSLRLGSWSWQQKRIQRHWKWRIRQKRIESSLETNYIHL
jgi:hypothetical protein